MVRRKDQVDALIEEWARIRREVVGIKHPMTARDYLGPLRSTLGSQRDLHAGARSEGRMDQNWPPFPYESSPNAQLVNWLFWKAPPTLKEVFDWHWVLLVPRNKGMRADLMGISPRVYWERVARVKAYVEGGLALSESVRTVSRQDGAINRTSASAASARD